MGFPPETSQTCWRKESASPSPPSAPSTCTWSWSNVRKTKRKQLKVKNIPWKQKTFFFFCDHTHVDIRPVVALGRGSLAVTWPLATAARGVRVCVRGRGAGSLGASSTSASSYSFQAAASGPRCHLGSSWHAEPAPTWPAAHSTSGGHSHLPLTRRFSFLHR